MSMMTMCLIGELAITVTLTVGVGVGDFIGVPVYVGGATPATYADFRLAAGSPGKGAASDGLDIGIR